MHLPVCPPVAPMLARLAHELPVGDHFFEPKWDGFRCLVFRDGDEVELRSRNQRPLGRYFPEIVDAVRTLPEPRVVLDGELLVTVAGTFAFEALMMRLHPSPSRVQRLKAETPASFVAFDLLAAGDDDLRGRPFEERRSRLAGLVGEAPPPLFLTPCTDDRDLAARWLDQPAGAGIDGVVAKRHDLRYEPGRREMVKVKRDRTADCVVAGFRLFAEQPAVGSLLLGVYDDDNALHHVGVVTSFAARVRAELFSRLAPLVVPLEGHSWEHGFGLERSPVGRLKGAAGRWTPDLVRDWEPLPPTLVAEVAYDRLEHDRFRHPARFRRWRPDRDPESCTFAQFPFR